jgi:integrase
MWPHHVRKRDSYQCNSRCNSAKNRAASSSITPTGAPLLAAATSYYCAALFSAFSEKRRGKARKAKVRHAHIFKHTCATHLFDKGFGIEQVQDWLGHVNVQSTAVYAHITNERRSQMADALRDSWK